MKCKLCAESHQTDYCSSKEVNYINNQYRHNRPPYKNQNQYANDFQRGNNNYQRQMPCYQTLLKQQNPQLLELGSSSNYNSVDQVNVKDAIQLT